jgi:hypothetical protein
MTREQREAWIKANPDKAAYALELFCRRMAPLQEMDLISLQKAMNKAGIGLTNRRRREMVGRQKRLQRQLINEKFFEYQKAVS